MKIGVTEDAVNIYNSIKKYIPNSIKHLAPVGQHDLRINEIRQLSLVKHMHTFKELPE